MASAYPTGLGNDQQAMQATAAMRQEPWYAAMMQAWGIDPKGDENGNVKLNDEQRQALRLAAEHHGIGFNNKYDGVDENGQIIEEHHKLKKIAIGAAIGGLALTGLGAAGIGPLAGAFGAGAGAAGATGAAATEAGVLPSTVIGSGFLPAITGSTGIIGGAGTAAAVGGGASTMAKIAAALEKAKEGGSTMSTVSDLLSAGGKGIGAAETAAGENRLDQEKLGLIYGAAIDENQRKGALQNVARQSMVENPRVSPFDPVGAPKYSDQYKGTISQLANFGADRLKKPQDVITPATVQKGTDTEPGTLSRIGQWLGPTTSIASKIPWDRIFSRA